MTTQIKSKCCPGSTQNPCNNGKQKIDIILSLSILTLVLTIGANALLHVLSINAPEYLHDFAHASSQILLTMWWGVAIGIVVIGFMNRIPRDYFTNLMGRSDTFSGLIRAVIGGLLLDLCCHGILLVAAKLYERGVSYAQVVTFLVSSPWNSVSLTLVLIGLIGLKFTILYILGSMVIAVVTGVILQQMTRAGFFPENPNTPEKPKNVSLISGIKNAFKNASPSIKGTMGILSSGWADGKTIIKWLLFGTIIAASLRTFVPTDVFAAWLGPNVLGLFITLLVATVIEICSEGSAPVAGEIVTTAHAPGNGFTFLMAGVATDYTELLAIREFTGKWAFAFAVPLITVPQILLIGWLMNMAG